MKERLLQLREEIIKHDIAYTKGAPTISDTEYDKLYYELVDLEGKFPELQSENSPTQRIYSAEIEGKIKVKHSEKMGSQKKIHTKKEVVSFNETLTNEGETIVLRQLKVDGLTIILKYKNGVLFQAITRGDGDFGYDVTHVMMVCTDIPKKIDFNGYLEIRCEAVITKEQFAKLYKEAPKDDKPKNARNLTSGVFTKLDTSAMQERQPIIVVFDVINSEGMEFKYDTERLEFIENLGFRVVPTMAYSLDDEIEMKSLVDDILVFNDKFRGELEYGIDGLVLKANTLAIRKEMGSTRKSPRWACAFKFEAEESISVLNSVFWTVGKTGKITPNANIDEVDIDGSTVKSASLANPKNIISRDIKIGDTVVVIKANDIIPQIVRPILKNRTGEEIEIAVIEKCPICNSHTNFDGTSVYCENTDCAGQFEAKLNNFVDRSTLNIDGFGEKTVSAFIEHNIVNNISDILDLEEKRENIIAIPKFGQKKLDKILTGIENAKKLPLNKIIRALSIKNVAEDKSIILAEEFKSMDNILSAVREDRDSFYNRLLNLKDYGEKRAKSVLAFFENEGNIELIEKMKVKGFLMLEEDNKDAMVIPDGISGDKIANKVFVVTGTLSKPRNEFKDLIKSLGGKVTGSVSKKTDYLLLGEGEEESKKYKTALELGTTILSEEEFNKLL